MILFMTLEIDHLKPYPRVVGEFLLLALTLAATLPTAYLTYRYVERPGIRLGHTVAEKVTGLVRQLRSSHTTDEALPGAAPAMVKSDAEAL
jgi:peptidoglycan/LPS O-acetylase OafA/YrhL